MLEFNRRDIKAMIMGPKPPKGPEGKNVLWMDTHSAVPLLRVWLNERWTAVENTDSETIHIDFEGVKTDVREIQSYFRQDRSIVVTNVDCRGGLLKLGNTQFLESQLITFLGFDDRITALEQKETVKYTAGDNIIIEDGIISAIDTTYSNATEETSGLMSYQDKIKLNGLNNYILPKASASVLGGIKVGDTLTIDANGVLNSLSSVSIDDAVISTTNTWSSYKINSELSGKQDALIAGDNVTISDNTISVTIPNVINDIVSSADTTYSSNKIDTLLAGKQDTLTAGQNIVITNNTISAVIDAGFQVEVVQTLTETGEANTIYFVPKAGSANPDVYDEYMYINNAWEKIGSTEVDLSNYYNKTEVEGLLNGKQDKLTAGNNITINGNTISANDTTYSAGANIDITDNAIKAVGYRYNTTNGAFAEGDRDIVVGETTYPKSNATGRMAHAEGSNTNASTECSHTEGFNTSVTSGRFGHAEGNGSKAQGNASHAEGQETTASAYFSHSEGYKSKAQGNASHAEGNSTTAGGNTAHAEGYSTKASGSFTHAEGISTIAQSSASHAEGSTTKTSGDCSHAEGYNTETGGNYTTNTKTQGNAKGAGAYAHAEGNATIAQGIAAHSEGYKTLAKGTYSHAEGGITIANGGNSHTEGRFTQTQNNAEHAQGSYNISHKATDSFDGNAGNTLHSIGIGTAEDARKNAVEVMQNGDAYLLGVGGYDGVHIKGETGAPSGLKTLQETVNGKQDTLTEGNNITINGNTISAKDTTYSAGDNIYITNNRISALGYEYNSGNNSITNGDACITAGENSHAEGYLCVTEETAIASHAEGWETVVRNQNEHTQGRYNVSHLADATVTNHDGNTIVSVGIGEDDANRKNAFEIMQNGDIYVYGLGNYNGTETKFDNPSVMTLQDILKTIADNIGVDIGVLF